MCRRYDDAMTPKGAVIRHPADTASAAASAERTFLWSATAPDGPQVRQALSQIRQNSRKRKRMAYHSLLGIALLALVVVATD